MTADFRHQIACTGRADEMVIDGSNPHQRRRQEVHALSICAECALLERCRRWVLGKADDPSPVMVVGGMTPGERRRERFGNEACGTDRGWQRHRKAGESCQACLAAHNEYTRLHKQAWRARNKTKGSAA